MPQNIKNLLDDAEHSLKQLFQHTLQVESARLDAELLLAHSLQKPRSYFYSWPEQVLSDSSLQLFNTLLNRRKTGEPIAYILQYQDFWNLRFKVSPATLIPRPETELLVEKALELIPSGSKKTIADLGTGSGAIALSVAHERHTCSIFANDISAHALKIAKYNAIQHHIHNVFFIQSSWFQGLSRNKQFDLILSNPPYISEHDPHLQHLKYEPHNALIAKQEGMEDLEHIIAKAPYYLKTSAYLLLEHGYKQQQSVQTLLQQYGYSNIQSFRDLAGQPRLSIGQAPSTPSGWRTNTKT